MAEPVKDVIKWLQECQDAAFNKGVSRDSIYVAVDDDGLSLVVLDHDGKETGQYYEIGGFGSTYRYELGRDE